MGIENGLLSLLFTNWNCQKHKSEDQKNKAAMYMGQELNCIEYQKPEHKHMHVARGMLDKITSSTTNVVTSPF